MSLSWKNLFVSVLNTNKTIKTKYVDLIKGTSGCVKPGEVLAIMGPSGGGKTTLLNALAGRIPCGSLTQGSITYKDKARNINNWFNNVGLVEQEMSLLSDLTVTETLYYHYKFNTKKINIKLKKESNIELPKEEELIKNLILNLNLDNVSNNLVKKLSGGEKKRTIIGTLLVSKPSILFLDEPTTGLDTLTAMNIMNILKKLAVEQQKIVILSIHQPSLEIFLMFDKLILISSGFIMYNGQAEKTEKYFYDFGFTRRVNITVPEHIMEICTNVFKNENIEYLNYRNYISSTNSISYTAKTKRFNDTRFALTPSISHIFILLKRRFQILKRRKWEFIKNLLAKLFTTSSYLIGGFVYIYYIYWSLTSGKEITDVKRNEIFDEILFDYIKKGLFVLLSLSIMMPIQFSVSQFFEELSLVKTELTHQYYSCSSFFIFMLIYLLIQEIFASLILFIFFVSLFWKCDIYIAMIFLITPLVAVPFGLLIGSITPTKALIPLFSGVFGILSSITPGLYGMLNLFLKKETQSKYKYCSYFTYLLGFIPPLYYSAGLGHRIINKPEYDRNNEGFSCLNLRYLGPNQIRIEILYLMIPISIVICIIFGIFITGFKMNPRIRLEIEK